MARTPTSPVAGRSARAPLLTTAAILAAAIAAPAAAQQHTHPQPVQPPAGAQARRPQTAEEAQVEATLRALFAAAERGDLAALDTLYAGDSLTVVEGAGINRGWADYRDHHLGPELKEMKNFRYRPTDIEVHVAGPVAWAIFRYALQAEMGSRAIDAVGRGTAILERRGTGARARWVVRHTQTGSRARRPTDPPMG